MDQSNTLARKPSTTFLRTWRTHTGLSQEALAAKAGISTSTITRAERYKTFDTRSEIVHKLEKALGLEPFGLEKPPPGVPDHREEQLIQLCHAVDVLQSVEDLDPVPTGNEDMTPEEGFARWAVEWYRSSPSGRWDHDDIPWGAGTLRAAVGFLERLADAIDELEVLVQIGKRAAARSE